MERQGLAMTNQALWDLHEVLTLEAMLVGAR
jgi:hypothetical protein